MLTLALVVHSIQLCSCTFSVSSGNEYRKIFWSLDLSNNNQPDTMGYLFVQGRYMIYEDVWCQHKEADIFHEVLWKNEFRKARGASAQFARLYMILNRKMQNASFNHHPVKVKNMFVEPASLGKFQRLSTLEEALHGMRSRKVKFKLLKL